MSRTLNKVMLIGNVGKDPELKYTPSKIPVTSFRLATSETWKDRDNNLQEHTDWHTIVAWRGLAEVIHKLVKKGARVYIEGRIQTRTFDDKTGNRRHVVEVLADNMLLLEARTKRDGSDKDDFGDYSETHLDYDPIDFDDRLDLHIPPKERDDFPF
ncbi:MAG: single-stranded DNA-binding protein [Candidatus Kapabacteria bacterium]|nr:single-stranded DNA-binding protein [Candidatus Kapabacteria bacterium]